MSKLKPEKLVGGSEMLLDHRRPGVGKATKTDGLSLRSRHRRCRSCGSRPLLALRLPIYWTACFLMGWAGAENV